MHNLSFNNIFNREPRYKRANKQDRFVRNTTNTVLAVTKYSTESRYERMLKRRIETAPYKILDAPGIIDDYYLNILDWSENNHISIALSDTVYAYNVENKKVEEIYTSENDQYVSSVKSHNNILALGVSNGKIYFYDMNTFKYMGEVKTHEVRVAALAWNDNILSCGAKDGTITNIDIRSFKPTNIYTSHTQEVCGLEWSKDKRFLASGGNDNLINIHQLTHNIPRCTLNEHRSAVKALAWCPWRNNILVSGGGSKDKTIRFWDILDRKLEKSIDVDSQVTGLKFSCKYKELISTHGYANNNICLWKASSMQMISSFGNHDARVISTAISPDGRELATVAPDENLKFWKLYDKPESVACTTFGFR
ncbi:WD repeat domain protein [Spraguea lophii 42_110]|uniref:WD repeat domain protein n=1 Tax=Spraguea lophii (strain 42_110) TaxID=1358809 RepID=S7W880_SPRLO|nr:WD repeat domain protein [Spraguea lophii 42_110]